MTNIYKVIICGCERFYTSNKKAMAYVEDDCDFDKKVTWVDTVEYTDIEGEVVATISKERLY
ncbi:hypothetical protein LCGC14_2922340 [marine sediment metagenome]|uniref:Uncharacterized protein n=1 Tax=marine sediment metagenome TaxID=412755 RepID=A0A0F8ZW30_9ZZZZ